MADAADEGHVLATAIRTFEENRAELLKDGQGKWVAIHEKELLGVFPTRREALWAGYDRFPPGSGSAFLVRKIELRQEPLTARTVWFEPADVD